MSSIKLLTNTHAAQMINKSCLLNEQRRSLISINATFVKSSSLASQVQESVHSKLSYQRQIKHQHANIQALTASPSLRTKFQTRSFNTSSPTTQIPAANTIREASTQAKHQTIPLDDWRVQESFKASDIIVTKCKPHELKPKPDVKSLVFGHSFTDHMFRCDWERGEGWSVPNITKINNIELHPASKVLHYALETFEGAKAFRGDDNKIRFFRLDENIKRLNKSAERAALPRFDEAELIECIHKLVSIDQDWIPESKGQLNALYIRPTVIGVESSLGVAASRKAILYVLLSPVSSYFKSGFKPVTLYADPNYVRAWPGGVGEYKLGSNYGPTISIQAEAERKGFQQVLWLFGDDLKLTEVGTMNIFVAYRNSTNGRLCVTTPPLKDGLILPGITRASIVQLLKSWDDIDFEERYSTFGEIQKLAEDNNLVEIFGSGTACIVCPVSLIQLKDGPSINIPYQDITLTNNNNLNDSNLKQSLSKRILDAITDIQYGRKPHPWAQELCY